MWTEDEQNELKPFEDYASSIVVPKDVYESLPSYMKGLASWEVCIRFVFGFAITWCYAQLDWDSAHLQDLLAAVKKMNLHLKQKTKNSNFFTQDEVSSLELGQHNTLFLVLLFVSIVKKRRLLPHAKPLVVLTSLSYLSFIKKRRLLHHAKPLVVLASLSYLSFAYT